MFDFNLQLKFQVCFPPAKVCNWSSCLVISPGLDEATGASLKFTVLNPKGRVWLMVAGGGASVIYTDTVADLGFSSELGNYGEYSGAPNTSGERGLRTSVVYRSQHFWGGGLHVDFMFLLSFSRFGAFQSLSFQTFEIEIG